MQEALAEIDRLRARNAEHEERYSALEAKEEYRRLEAERLRADYDAVKESDKRRYAEALELRAALTATRDFIKDEQIAHAMMSAEGPSLLRFLDAAIGNDEQSMRRKER